MPKTPEPEPSNPKFVWHVANAITQSQNELNRVSREPFPCPGIAENLPDNDYSRTIRQRRTTQPLDFGLASALSRLVVIPPRL